MDLLEEYGPEELVMIPIDFLGLAQSPWDFSRGARTERKYMDDAGNVLITDSYEYTMDKDNRSVTSMKRHLEWFQEDGTSITSKDITKIMTAKALKALNREIRQGRMDYLEGEAEALRIVAAGVPSPYKEQYHQVADNIDALFAHYTTEVAEYIARGTTTLETAIENETSPVYNAILDIVTPIGLTVRQSILYQITGVLPNV